MRAALIVVVFLLCANPSMADEIDEEIDLSISMAEVYRTSGKNGLQCQAYTNYSSNLYLRAIALMLARNSMGEGKNIRIIKLK